MKDNLKALAKLIGVTAIFLIAIPPVIKFFVWWFQAWGL